MAHERILLQALKPAQCLSLISPPHAPFSQIEEGSTGVLETKDLLIFPCSTGFLPHPQDSYYPEVLGYQALARDSSGNDIIVLQAYFTFRVMVTSTES